MPGGKGKGSGQSCPPADFARNKAGLRQTWGHAAPPSPGGTHARPAAPSGGAAVRGAGAAGGGTAAARVGLRGGSVRAPEAAPAGPLRPRPGFPNSEPLFGLCRARS